VEQKSIGNNVANEAGSTKSPFSTINKSLFVQTSSIYDMIWSFEKQKFWQTEKDVKFIKQSN